MTPSTRNKPKKRLTRKLNFTGRKKIPKSQISIGIRQGEDNVKSFTAELNLNDLNLPPNAEVYIEAYRRHAYMRFPFGTVENIIIPENRSLSGFNPGETPRFRVKVVDRSAGLGKIVASADKIFPNLGDTPATERDFLLPVEHNDLGDQVWRLELKEDGPVLELNSLIENLRLSARSDGIFLSLVYPEVVRRVLTEILIGEKQNDPDCDEDDWQSQWLKYALSFPGIDDPPSVTSSLAEKEEWIEDIVNAFCNKWKVREKFSQSNSEESGVS